MTAAKLGELTTAKHYLAACQADLPSDQTTNTGFYYWAEAMLLRLQAPHTASKALRQATLKAKETLNPYRDAFEIALLNQD